MVSPGPAIAMIGTNSAFPVFWQMSNQLLSVFAAEGGIAHINSIGNLSSFRSPFMLYDVKASTGGFAPGLSTIAVIEALAVVLIIWFVPKTQASIKKAS